MFWLAATAANGDEFFFDDVVLAKVSSVAPPTIAAHPGSKVVDAGQTATFTVTPGGTPPFSFQWQKNSVDIPDANGPSYTTPATTVGDNGAAYRCIVKNPVGNTPSNAASLTVNPGAPGDRPHLLSPANLATAVPTATTLSWTSVPGALNYHLQLGTDSVFVAGLIKNDSTIVDTSRQVAGLPSNTTLYWRVRAKTGTGATLFSDSWTFRTIAGLPAMVTLVSPAHGATINATSQRFNWNRSTLNTTRYWFELSTDSLFLGLKMDDSTLTDTTRLVSPLLNNTTYWWRVRAGNSDGWGLASETRRLRVVITDVPVSKQVPTSFALEQNYPNPFNPSTLIAFSVPQETHVLLEIFSLLGNKIATLVDERFAAGRYSVSFDAGSISGRAPLSSGPYIYRLSAGGTVIARKMAFVK
jgi:hypothetical protein